MNELSQWIVVITVVATALIISIYKLIKRGSRSSKCSDCPNCPLADSCKTKERNRSYVTEKRTKKY